MSTQREIATHLDLSERRVRDLVRAGVIPRGADIDTARGAYIRHLRAMASAHQGDGPLDLVQERAALAAIQRQQIEIKLAKERNQLIPFDVLDHLLGSTFSEIRAGLLSQHNTIAAEYPEIPPGAIRGILRSNRELLQRLAETPFPKTLSDEFAKLEREACDGPS